MGYSDYGKGKGNNGDVINELFQGQDSFTIDVTMVSLDDGNYNGQVVKAVLHKSKAGNINLKLDIEVNDGSPEGERPTLTDYIPIPIAGRGGSPRKMASFLKEIGGGTQYELKAPTNGEFQELVGLSVTIGVKNETDDDLGTKEPRIAKYGVEVE